MTIGIARPCDNDLIVSLCSRIHLKFNNSHHKINENDAGSLALCFVHLLRVGCEFFYGLCENPFILRALVVSIGDFCELLLIIIAREILYYAVHCLYKTVFTAWRNALYYIDYHAIILIEKAKIAKYIRIKKIPV